jgi:hypothetical protein
MLENELFGYEVVNLYHVSVFVPYRRPHFNSVAKMHDWLTGPRMTEVKGMGVLGIVRFANVREVEKN